MAEGTILITGAGGFLGTALAPAVKAAMPGMKIIAMGRMGPGAVDLAMKADTRALLESTKPRLVFHLAGLAFSADEGALHTANVVATENLLAAASTLASPPRIIIPGSAAEYGPRAHGSSPITEDEHCEPSSPYGRSKLQQTLLAVKAAKGGLPVIVGRIFNILTTDPRSVSGALLRQAAASEIRVGNLSPVRDFLGLYDVCAGLLALAQRGRAGEIYNICSGRGVTVESLLGLIMAASGSTARVEHDPALARHGENPFSRGSAAKILRDTGWAPRHTLEQSIGLLFPSPLE